jgi:hypothetical protein
MTSSAFARLARFSSIAPWLFVPSLIVLGCNGEDESDDDDSSNGGRVGTLEEECASYCAKQAAIACPQSLSIGSCQQSCEGVTSSAPECEPPWRALNHCMGNAALFCDAQGQPAVGEECFPEVDAFGDCLAAR